MAEKKGMKRFLVFFLLSGGLWAASALRIVSVGRIGLPPYEQSDRIYRLEGPGCPVLRVGELLVLKREGERRDLGRLEVLSIHTDHAEAKLTTPGETFPLKGDLAVRTELLHGLPAISVPAFPAPLPSLASLRPRTVAEALPRAQGPAHREPIYFLKGDASLSPGALVKLQTWVDQWGPQGQWILDGPRALSTLHQERLSALRAELQRLGIPVLEIRAMAEEPPGRYDAIYIMKEPW